MTSIRALLILAWFGVVDQCTALVTMKRASPSSSCGVAASSDAATQPPVPASSCTVARSPAPRHTSPSAAICAVSASPSRCATRSTSARPLLPLASSSSGGVASVSPSARVAVPAAAPRPPVLAMFRAATAHSSPRAAASAAAQSMLARPVSLVWSSSGSAASSSLRVHAATPSAGPRPPAAPAHPSPQIGAKGGLRLTAQLIAPARKRCNGVAGAAAGPPES